jgi:acyl-CoA synthetase (NDP forming)
VTDVSLDALFCPSSVAVYGASSGGGRLGNTLLRNVADSTVDVRCVHPSAPAVDGIAAEPSLSAPTDLALISVPVSAAEGAVRDALAAGVRALVVLSCGFGEAGPDGLATQNRITALAERYGAPLVGPNCMGVVSHLGGSRWLNGSYFSSIPTRPGPVSFISQSGGFGAMFMAEMTRRNVGFARFASLGNCADVAVTDAVRWLGEDRQTEVIGVFCEALRDGRAFVETVRRITPHKPVVVLKGGRGGAGARAAAGHTGSLAGSARAYAAGFRRAGVCPVDSSDELFDVLAAFVAPALRRHGDRIGIITVSGGPGVLAADAVERLGLRLPVLDAQRRGQIAAYAPDFAATANPVDLTAQCAPGNFAAAVAQVYADPSLDAIIAINCGLDVVEFGSAIAAAYAATGKPTTACLVDVPRIRAVMAAAGIACFDSPEAAVRAQAAGPRR